MKTTLTLAAFIWLALSVNGADYKKIDGVVYRVPALMATVQDGWHPIDGTVIQIIGGDALVRNRGDIVYVYNLPNAEAKVDGSTARAVTRFAGIKEYVTAIGGTSRVYSFDAGVTPTRAEIERAFGAQIAREEKEEKELEEQRKRFLAEKKKEEEAQEKAQALAEAQKQADHMAAITKARKAQADKILAYQLSQASNGLPSFQLILGQRYLKGDGVDIDLALAKHWLQSACTNGEAQASNLVSRLP